jgi:twitching motility protein PilT
VAAPAGSIDRLIRTLWEAHGSDILLVADSPPLLRIDGVLAPVDGGKSLKPVDIERTLFEILEGPLLERYHADKQVDFSFGWQDKARFRGNAFTQRGSPALALRMIPLRIPKFDELGIPEQVRRWVDMPQGFLLVTGATGSGKSTTLASVLDQINERRQVHILTVEDPIEYVHQHKRSAVCQREVGEDTVSFPHALRAALREDPDVLLIGEMRDPESIQAALTIAETGHLVFATLHTNDTAQALDRIVDVFPGERQPQIRLQLANTLAGVLHQQLVPKISGGRVAAFEILIGTHAVRNLIREGKSRQIRNIVATGQNEGMQTMEMSLSDLVALDLVTLEDARARSLYPNEIQAPRPEIDVAPEEGARQRRTLSRGHR